MILSLRLRIPDDANLNEIQYHVDQLVNSAKSEGKVKGYVHYNYDNIIGYSMASNERQSLRIAASQSPQGLHEQIGLGL